MYFDRFGKKVEISVQEKKPHFEDPIPHVSDIFSQNFIFSQNGKKLSVEELRSNYVKLYQ